MSTHNQNKTPTGNKREPLYASPWIALFIMLRQKLTPPRKSTPEKPGSCVTETPM